MPLGFRTRRWSVGVGRSFFSFPDRTTEPHGMRTTREYGARRTRAAGPTTDGGYSVRVI